MTKLPRILLTLSLGAAVAASAQTSGTPETDENAPRPGRGHRFHHRGPGPAFAVVRALDTDRNRELSAEEIANASAALRTLDKNSDGTVSKDELRPLPPGGSGEGRRPADTTKPADKTAERPAKLPLRKSRAQHRGPGVADQQADPIMLAVDANKDGDLAESEIANAPASLSALDLNKDGKLTLDELRPLPPVE